MVHQQEYLKLIEEHTRNTEEHTRYTASAIRQIKWSVWIFTVFAFAVGVPVNFRPFFMPAQSIRTVQSSESNSQTKQASSPSVSSSSTRKLAANIERPKSINVTGSMLDH